MGVGFAPQPGAAPAGPAPGGPIQNAGMPPGQAPAGGVGMSQTAGPNMVYSISNGQGVETTVDDQYVMTQLQQGGFNPQSISPDGSTVKLMDAQGEYEIPVREALGGMGWQTSEAKPAPGKAIFGNESGELRAAITKLPNEQAVRQYLEQALQNQGMHGAKIEGSGRDWFVFSPLKGQWISLTNNPDWDSTDAVEAAMEIPRMAGSIIGGAGGASVGNVPGFIAGTAGGGFVGDAIGRAGLAMYDPDYANVSEEHLGGIIKDMAVGSAVDAGSAGLLRGAGPLASKYINKGVGGFVQGATDKGIASQALRHGGQIAEGVGTGIQKGAQAIDTPMGRSAAGMFVPGVAETEMIGAVMQAPGLMTRNIPGAMSKVGRSKVMQKYAPKAGDWIDNQSHRFRTVRADQPVASKLESSYGIPRKPNAGFDPYQATSESVARSVAAGGSESQKKAAGYIGRGMDQGEYLGQKMQDVAQGTMGGVLKGAQGGGYAMSKMGRAAQTLGDMTGPIESRVAARYGVAPQAEEALGQGLDALDNSADGLDSYLKNELEALRRKRMRSNIESNSMGY